MIDNGHVFEGRLNTLQWEGCNNLWAHLGLDAHCDVPGGYHTVGVPGVLVSCRIPSAIKTPSARLDDLVRARVGDAWEEGCDQVFKPVRIMEDFGGCGNILHIREGDSEAYVADSLEFGWAEFTDLMGLIRWLGDHELRSYGSD